MVHGKKFWNIFALVILAQLAIMEAKNNQTLRRERKTALTRELFTSGLEKATIAKLYRFIDWLIKLNPEHMITFKEEVKGSAARESWQDWDPVYVSTFEQVAKIEGLQEGLQEGRQKGRQEGRQEGEASLLLHLLKRRFANRVTEQHQELLQQADCHTLSQWGENLMEAKKIDDVFMSL